MQNKSYIDPMVPGLMSGVSRLINLVTESTTLMVSSAGCLGELHLQAGYHGEKLDCPMISPLIMENDIIFGMEERVNKIVQNILATNNKKKILFIVSSNTSEIIGEDYTSIASSQANGDTKILYIEGGNYSGDQFTGFERVLDKICLNIIDGTLQKIDNSVNIIGIIGDELSAEKDVDELTRLLSLADISINCIFIKKGTTFDQLRRASQARLNIVVNEEFGLSLAEKMKEMYNIPYVFVLPYGIKGTIDFINKVCNFFGKDEKGEKVLQDEINTLTPFLQKALTYVYSSLNCIVSGDPSFAVGLSTILKEVGINPRLICLRSGPGDNLKQILDNLKSELDFCDLEIFVTNDYVEYINKIKTVADSVSIIFGSSLDQQIPYLCNGKLKVIELSYPCWYEIDKLENPIMGVNGIKNIAQRYGTFYNTNNF